MFDWLNWGLISLVIAWIAVALGFRHFARRPSAGARGGRLSNDHSMAPPPDICTDPGRGTGELGTEGLNPSKPLDELRRAPEENSKVLAD
jgi:hypothetical protein